jgi:hypothetical protein
MKGPGPSIKEDTWKAVKGSGKGPKYFGSRRSGPLISQRDIFQHFGNRGFKRQRTGGNIFIVVSRIMKANSALSWTVILEF